MRNFVKILIKLIASLFASGIAFCFGFLLSGMYYDRRILPEVIKQYPKDGQIGLESFEFSM